MEMDLHRKKVYLSRKRIAMKPMAKPKKNWEESLRKKSVGEWAKIAYLPFTTIIRANTDIARKKRCPCVAKIPWNIRKRSSLRIEPIYLAKVTKGLDFPSGVRDFVFEGF